MFSFSLKKCIFAKVLLLMFLPLNKFTDAATLVIDPWTVIPYEDIEAYVGDEIEFIYESHHNVVEFMSQSDYDSCDKESYLELAKDGPFTLSLDEPGERFIACTIMQHCEYGQKFKLTVLEKVESQPVMEKLDSQEEDLVMEKLDSQEQDSSSMNVFASTPFFWLVISYLLFR